jgi:hypothetical protein
MATEKVQQGVNKTLCKDCIKQLSDVFGEDTGINEAVEFYNLFQLTFATDWIDDLTKGKIENDKIYYLISAYCRGEFENYYQYVIEWLIKTDDRCINLETFENFLVAKSGQDFRGLH